MLPATSSAMARGMNETVVATLRVSTSDATFVPIAARVRRVTSSRTTSLTPPPVATAGSSTSVVATRGSQ